VEVKEPTRSIARYYLNPQTGNAFTVQKGQTIRVVDVEGGQVSDLVCFTRQDIEEYLSSGRTIDYNEKLFLSTGDILYSNRSNRMLTIVEDPVGKHDFLFAPCSQEMFRLTYDETQPHPNCLNNLASALGQYGVKAFQIPTAFNIFMNVEVSTSGEVAVKPPLSKPGDFIDLRAETDLIVGVTACAAGKCNNYRCTPIAVEIYDTINRLSGSGFNVPG
jgi:uncharacterized protein YcgI (DUF1989 family)